MTKPSQKAEYAPLRRVVKWFASPNGTQYELLECDHQQVRKQDIYGPTNATRRRCEKCRREAAR